MTYNPKDLCTCGNLKSKYAKHCNDCARKSGVLKVCPRCGDELSIHARCNCTTLDNEPLVKGGNYLNSAESMFQEPYDADRYVRSKGRPNQHKDYWQQFDEEFVNEQL
jgi:hypothetical protein